MSMYDEQIKARRENDDILFAQAFENLLCVIQKNRVDEKTALGEVTDAAERIFSYYHLKNTVPKDLELPPYELFEAMLRRAGMSKRRVALKDDWYKSAVCPMLGTLIEGESHRVVALLPSVSGGYFYEHNGKKIRVTKAAAARFDSDAFCFYRPLPQTKLCFMELIKYLYSCVTMKDIIIVILLTIAVTLAGMLLPIASNLVYQHLIPSGNVANILPMAVFLIGIYFCNSFAAMAKQISTSQFNKKIQWSVQNASMTRLFSMPASFFKNYSAGELAARSGSITELCNMIKSVILDSALTTLFSLLYIGQMSAYAPVMVVPGMIAIALQLAFSVVSVFVSIKRSRKQREQNAKISGFIYSVLSGIQKIKLCGAEKRVFSKWAEQYKHYGQTRYQPPLIIGAAGAFGIFVSAVGTFLLYKSAGTGGVTLPDYISFTAAYSSVAAAFMSLNALVTTIASIKPVWAMAKPMLDTLPENASADKKTVTHISGSIEINNLTFSYGPGLPKIIDGLNLKIKSGEYIAIVGKTGCGKSTLMRLLLGFEKPELGAIYFDGQDIETLDLGSLRCRIGVNLQEGKLFAGDLFSNIIIAAPNKTLMDAWEAARLAGLDEDIKKLPMGMQTIVSEGKGGFSGGQKQRILIARALVTKPKLLIMDEATSALDNITQKLVSDNIDKLKCTRIVIAHRVSTIRQCDRIVMLDKGKIIEEGSFDALMQARGEFYDLVKKQTL